MDFLGVADLGGEGLAEVLRLAAAVKADPGSVAGSLAGKKIGLFFEKPSTRTRVSCEVAAADLGAVPVVLHQAEVGLEERESAGDVGRVLDRLLDVIAMRVFEHGSLVTIADAAESPVVNLLSDLEHPCQALADLQTLAEARPIEGSVLAYVGDGNNVCHSLLMAGALAGVTVRVATPPGYGPSADMVAAARSAARPGAEINVGNDAAGAVAGADVVYTDVWASMGQEEEAEERRRAFEAYRVDEALFGLAAGSAIFLHCLPAHRGDEVTDGVIDHERSRVFDQAENRMHSFKALLLHLVG